VRADREIKFPLWILLIIMGLPVMWRLSYHFMGTFWHRLCYTHPDYIITMGFNIFGFHGFEIFICFNLLESFLFPIFLCFEKSIKMLYKFIIESLLFGIYLTRHKTFPNKHNANCQSRADN